jgi:hypothetical protein
METKKITGFERKELPSGLVVCAGCEGIVLNGPCQDCLGQARFEHDRKILNEGRSLQVSRESATERERDIKVRIDLFAAAALGALLVGCTISPEQAAEQAEEYAHHLAGRLDVSSAARLDAALKRLEGK